MPHRLPTRDRALLMATVCGCLYTTVVLLWAVMTGIQFTTGGPLALGGAVGYAGIGLFLIAAVPIYALGRYSLVSPVLVAAWSLGNTIYLRWYVPRPHDALASYLTVWPLIVGLVGLAAFSEVGLRLAADRTFGRFGLRSLVGSS